MRHFFLISRHSRHIFASEVTKLEFYESTNFWKDVIKPSSSFVDSGVKNLLSAFSTAGSACFKRLSPFEVRETFFARPSDEGTLVNYYA